MNKKRLLILGIIVVLSLGSLGAVQYLTTGKSIEESGSGYVQNLAEPTESEPGLTESSEDRENPTESSEAGEESAQVSLHVDPIGHEISSADDIGTDFDWERDWDSDAMNEIDKNTIERASEFDYQYNEEALASIDPGLFSDSVNNIGYADITCHKVLLSVLSQYADDHGEDYGVFEMESYYKSMFVEDGIWGHKVLDTAANKMLYIAYTWTAFETVGYLYTVE